MRCVCVRFCEVINSEVFVARGFLLEKQPHGRMVDTIIYIYMHHNRHVAQGITTRLLVEGFLGSSLA